MALPQRNRDIFYPNVLAGLDNRPRFARPVAEKLVASCCPGSSLKLQ